MILKLVAVAGLLMAPCVLLLLVALIGATVRAWRVRRTIARIDALDEREATEREFDEAFDRLLDLDLQASPEAGRRLRETDRASRRRWLPFADDESLRAVAEDLCDPLAPFAWREVRWPAGEGVEEGDEIRAWARDVISSSSR